MDLGTRDHELTKGEAECMEVMNVLLPAEIDEQAYEADGQGPWMLLPHLYIGSCLHAYDVGQLKRIGITRVVNCAEDAVKTGPDFYGTDFSYLGFPAQDQSQYNILGRHFDDVRKFIDAGDRGRERTLVHCVAGINRSGALCVAYCLTDGQENLIDTIRHVSSKRRCLLSNVGFRLQLIRWAGQQGRLPTTPSVIKPMP